VECTRCVRLLGRLDLTCFHCVMCVCAREEEYLCLCACACVEIVRCWCIECRISEGLTFKSDLSYTVYLKVRPFMSNLLSVEDPSCLIF